MAKLTRHHSDKKMRALNDQSFHMTCRRELSPLGHGFIILFCCLTVFYTSRSYFVEREHDKWQRKLNHIKKDYNERISNILKESRGNNRDGNHYLKREILSTKNELEIMEEKERIARTIIEDQKLEIVNLKEKLQLFVKKDFNRGLKAKNKLLVYSRASMNSLDYRHTQKLINLRKEQRRKREIFLENYDVSDPSNAEHFKNYIDNQEIEFVELKNRLSERRDLFRKQKFIKLVDNN